LVSRFTDRAGIMTASGLMQRRRKSHKRKGPLHMSTRPEDSYSELREYLWLIWVRRGSVLLVMLTVVLAAMFYSSRQTKLYQSSAEVLIRPLALDPRSLVSASQVLNPLAEERVASSLEVGSAAVKRLGDLKLPASVSVQATPGGTLVFTSASPIPIAAQRTAQAYAEAYLAFREQEILDGVRAESRPLEQRIGELNRQIEDVQSSLSAAATPSERLPLKSRFDSLSALRQFLEEKRNGLILPEVLRVGWVLQPAALPVVPISPNRQRPLIMGLLVGLALGAGQAVLRARFNPRLYGRSDLAARMRRPVLGLIPEIRRRDGRDILFTLAAPGSQGAEAYRALRAGVLLAVERQRVRSLLITSPNAREGKTSTAANLAVALAQAGRRVILLSADLHRPGLQSYFAAPGEFGLTSLLATDGGEVDLTTTFIPGLRVLHSGPPEAASRDLLGSRAMRRVLDQLEASADLVIIDAPPVLGTADALAIAPLADGVLVVAAAEGTTCAAIDETRIRLEQVEARVIGAVLNRVDGRTRLDPRYDRRSRDSFPSVGAAMTSGGWSA
jgi:capsular exopolysaccharide synthesis family protein